MKLVAFLSGCLIAAPLCAYEREGAVITLTPDEVKACEEGGGCVVRTIRVIERAIERAEDDGRRSERIACRNIT